MNSKQTTKTAKEGLSNLHDEMGKIVANHSKPASEDPEHTVSRLRIGLGGMTRTLAKIVELRDPCKHNHHQVVANLSRAIADEMGLDRDQVENIRLAAAVHDMGKIYVPVEILTKPGKLTTAEFEQVKTHPAVALTILRQSGFPKIAAKIVEQHHERIDGSGYPYNLKGEEILLEAKILAIADVLDAMLSVRPHRKAIGFNEAMAEVNRLKGTIYDEMVTEACLDLFANKRLEDFA